MEKGVADSQKSGAEAALSLSDHADRWLLFHGNGSVPADQPERDSGRQPESCGEMGRICGQAAAAAGIALCACRICRFDIAAASAETHLEKPLRTRRACDGCRCCGNGVPDDLENQQLLLCTGIYRGVHHYCMVRLSLRLVQDRGKAAESSDLYYHWCADVPDGSIHSRVHHLPA